VNLNGDFVGSAFIGTEFDVSNRMFIFGQGQSFDDSLPTEQPTSAA
jgi:hypothetical protein